MRRLGLSRFLTLLLHLFFLSGVFVFAFAFTFSRELHSSRASIRTLGEPAWVRCLLGSDDDEGALLSKDGLLGQGPGSQSPEREFGYALWQKDANRLI
jgi:hypothetical protein